MRVKSTHIICIPVVWLEHEEPIEGQIKRKQSAEKQVHQKTYEIPIVIQSYRIEHPRAVVVHLIHARIHDAVVVAAGRFHSVALTAESVVHIGELNRILRSRLPDILRFLRGIWAAITITITGIRSCMCTVPIADTTTSTHSSTTYTNTTTIAPVIWHRVRPHESVAKCRSAVRVLNLGAALWNYKEMYMYIYIYNNK